MDADLDEHDESVRIAIKALGDMRNGSRTLSPLSTSSSSPISPSYAGRSPILASPTASSSHTPPSDGTPPIHSSSMASSAPLPPGLVSRMSHLPLVGSALWAYEQGKASSRVVKYGAEMVESSVKSISRPVIDRLPVNVNQLDEFACRQLDRLDKYRRPSANASERPSSPIRRSSVERGGLRLNTNDLDGSAVDDDDLRDQEEITKDPSTSRMQISDRANDVPRWIEATSPFVAPPPPPPDTRSVTPTQKQDSSEPSQSDQREVAQRSRWQAVLLEAGGLSAALSEDSMKRLKYCLQWLQYATAHIDAQMLILRDFIASLQPLPSSTLQTNRRPPLSEEHMKKLTDVRRDIVQTIRQVVDVVSKYAGGALPEPARGRVRGFILGLPGRWARTAGPLAVEGRDGERERETVVAAATGTGVRRVGGQRRAAQRERGTGSVSAASASSSRATSPCASPRISRAAALDVSTTGSGEPAPGTVSHTSARIAAQRILTLATESLDMMRNVTGVMKESLDRADAWVGRLRTVGIQRGVQEGEDGDGEDMRMELVGMGEGREGEGFEEFSERMRYRRRASTQSSVISGSLDEGSLDRDRDSLRDVPPSPFFSATASASGSNWESMSSMGSIPSTPGAPGSSGSFVFGSGAGAPSGSGSGSYATARSAMSVDVGGVGAGAGDKGLVSPLGGMGRMSLSSITDGMVGSQAGSRYGEADTREGEGDEQKQVEDVRTPRGYGGDEHVQGDEERLRDEDYDEKARRRKGGEHKMGHNVGVDVKVVGVDRDAEDAGRMEVDL